MSDAETFKWLLSLTVQERKAVFISALKAQAQSIAIYATRICKKCHVERHKQIRRENASKGH